MNNRLITIQETLIKEMKRLDDNEHMEQAGANEIARSNALTNNALTYIKSVNAQLRIKEVADKYQQTTQSLTKELGIEDK